MAEQTPEAFKEESACRGWIEAHDSVGPCNICSRNVEGLSLRCGFSESLLELRPELCCETSPLLLRLGSSSRALGGSRSLKQIGRCHGQIWMPLKPLFILVLQKVKKNKPGAVCQEYPSSSSCAHHFLPFGAGDIENICLQMRWEGDSPLPPLLSRGPSGFTASSFLIPFLPGTPVNSNPHPAVQVRRRREQFLQPSRMAGDQPSHPSPNQAVSAWRSFTPYAIHSRRRRCRYKPHFYSKPGSSWTFRSALLDGNAMHCHLAIRAR